MGLDDALEYIVDDELVEVTPLSIRIRKVSTAQHGICRPVTCLLFACVSLDSTSCPCQLLDMLVHGVDVGGSEPVLRPNSGSNCLTAASGSSEHSPLCLVLFSSSLC